MSLYLVADKYGNSKIGYTAKDDVEKRIKDLQTAASSQLTLIASCPGSKTDEKRWHQKFASQRIKGAGTEWLNLTPEQIEDVRKDFATAHISAPSDLIDRLVIYGIFCAAYIALSVWLTIKVFEPFLNCIGGACK